MGNDFIPDNPDGTPGPGVAPGGEFRDFIPDPPKPQVKPDVPSPTPLLDREVFPEPPDVSVVTLERADPV